MQFDEEHSIDWIASDIGIGLPDLTTEIWGATKIYAMQLEYSLMLTLSYHFRTPSSNPSAGHLLKCQSCAEDAVELHKALTTYVESTDEGRHSNDCFMLPEMWHNFSLFDPNTVTSSRDAVAAMVRRYTNAYQIQSDIVAHLNTDWLLWRTLITDPLHSHLSVRDLWYTFEDQMFFQGSVELLERQAIYQTALLETLGRNLMIMSNWLIDPSN